MKTIQLWHGGRNLESDYKDYGGTAKGRWEHGPGLYLTTHYERAQSYAKGGGKTYLVTVAEGNDIDKTFIDISLVNEFVSRHVIKSKQTRILDSLYEYMKRVNTTPKVQANILVNLIINDEGMSNTKTSYLNQFLVENDVDYGFVKRYGGREETVMVIFDRSHIKSVKAMPAKEVTIEDFVQDVSFVERNTIKPR